MQWAQTSQQGAIAPTLLISLFIFIAGIAFWGSFNWAMELTNNEKFCISCHEMQQNVFSEYKNTVHYSNRTGVRATCPDCHVPKQWLHKVKRKIQATNELYHWMVGSIDTRDKFLKKRGILAQHVWTSMQQTDSRECRNCHDKQHMDLKKQSNKSKNIHSLSAQWGNTCIDCHQGIAHTLPESFDKEAQIDQWHKKLEEQNVSCNECHDSMQKTDLEEW